VSPSNNGTGSAAWSTSWAHLRLDRRRPAYCRVTFGHPPINAIAATTGTELAELVALIEGDDDLNVAVFASADPDVYLVEHDGMSDPDWADLLGRLSRAPVISIAAIRGRVRGAAKEFVSACDLRMAVRENNVLRLDAEVDAIAARFERHDHEEIARAKSSVRSP
jgi:enoyl-CoA hydratase/carnithine racemase